MDLLNHQENCQSHQNSSHGSTEKFCTAIFDGLLCWNTTKAGSFAKQHCPDYYKGMNPQKFVMKKCEESGEWQDSDKLAIYLQCYKLLDNQTAYLDIELNEDISLFQKWVPIMKTVTHVGYVTSLVTLIIAIVVFGTIKRLHCARNKLHMHLFMSFILRAFTVLLKDFLFVNGIAFGSDIVSINGQGAYITENYNWLCKAVIIAKNYFILTNYAFILIEGIYLHNLMFLTPFSDNNRLVIYYSFGWGLPFIFIVPWIILRANFEDTMCWTTSDSKYFPMLISVPIGLSITINLILFITIVRVLFVKLNSMYIQQRKIKYRRLIRSTLILIPLFGVPYTVSLILSLIINYGQAASATLELVWIFFDQTFIAFQGVLLAVIYCVINSEVRTEILSKYNSLHDRRQHSKRARTISNTLQSTLPQDETFGPPKNYLEKQTKL